MLCDRERVLGHGSRWESSQKEVTTNVAPKKSEKKHLLAYLLDTTRHVATWLGIAIACYVRLASLLQRVATCWVQLKPA